MVKRRPGGWGPSVFFSTRTSSLVYKRAVYKRGCHVVKTTAELAAGVGRMEACSGGRATRDACLKRGWPRWAQPFSSMETFQNGSGDHLWRYFDFVFLQLLLIDCSIIIEKS